MASIAGEPRSTGCGRFRGAGRTNEFPGDLKHFGHYGHAAGAAISDRLPVKRLVESTNFRFLLTDQYVAVGIKLHVAQLKRPEHDRAPQTATTADCPPSSAGAGSSAGADIFIGLDQRTMPWPQHRERQQVARHLSSCERSCRILR